MVSISQFIFNGLVLGSYIGLSAIGFTLVYGLLNMINFAHAEFMVIGAYLGVISMKILELPLAASLLFVLVGSALTGWVIARVFYYPIQEAGPIPLLITSVAVGVILRNIILLVAGSEPRFLPPVIGGVDLGILGGLQLSYQGILILGVAATSFIAIHLVLTRTDLGIALRAMGANEELAMITGIDTDFLRHHVWLVSAGTAGVAGFLISLTLYASPGLGLSRIIIVIAAAILGGAGSVYGAIIGAYLIGLILSVSTGVILPAGKSNLGTTVAFVVLVIVLFIRPEGIAGKDISSRRESL
jgi:branched-subunit amino acid ABC-type transport system permease component